MNETICDKVAYDSRGEAGRQIANFRNKGHHVYGVYTCLLCGKIHITTTSKKKMRRHNKMDKYPIRYDRPVEAESFKKPKRRPRRKH